MIDGNGRAASRGVELDVAGQQTRARSPIGSYGYTHARITGDPAFAGDDRLRSGTGGRSVARRPGDSANGFALPAYTVADAFVSCDTRLADRSVTLQFSPKNVFDRTYYTSAVDVYGVATGDPRRAIGAMSIRL